MVRCALRLAISEIHVQHVQSWRKSIRLAKIGNAPNDLEHLTVKSTLYTLNTPEVQIFFRFSLRLSISEIQGRQKSEMYRVTPN